MSTRYRALMMSWLFLLPGLLSAVEAGEHAAAPHTVPNSVWFHFINFAVLVYLLYRWLRAPLRGYLIKRQDTIRDALECAETARREAELRRQAYELRLAGLEEEIRILREETEGSARAEAAQIATNARAMAERIGTDTERLLRDELMKARYQLRQEAVDLAVDLARGMLSGNITEGDQRRLAEEYLERVRQSREIH